MLHLVEVLDSIQFLEKRCEKVSKKADVIDVVASCLDGLTIQEWLIRFDTLESRIVKTGNVIYEHGDSSSSYVAHIEE